MKIALVGSPNVGKSVIFHHLTGQYVTVSNYPGTTVEVTWGQFKWGGMIGEVVDTPGIYSLLPISGEELVTRQLLLEEKPDLVLHVIDGKNLKRMLPITLQLLEAGFPVILVINMMDEVRRRGIEIDFAGLAERLGIPVVPTVSISGEGIEELKRSIGQYLLEVEDVKSQRPVYISYPKEIRMLVKRIQNLLKGEYPISGQSLALFLLQDDGEILDWIKEQEEKRELERIFEILDGRSAEERDAGIYSIILAREEVSARIVQQFFDLSGVKTPKLQARLSHLCTNPITGFPILLAVLYFGIYKFVGGVGAGIMVDYLEGVVFQKWLNPLFVNWFTYLIPSETLRMLFVGEYGIFTLGLRYAVAIILPVVGTFFFMFSILEDSGYFPRLALLIDRVFKKIGLNGRAVIPMILGLGCDTMATLTTRILETRRERIIATLLLALAVPCSAQLGVITGLLSSVPGGLMVWFLVVGGVMLVVGYLAGKLMPGQEPGFYMEVPSLRWPKLANILVKTRARMQWYFIEILPIFIYSSVFIWIGQITGIFQKLLLWLEPVVKGLGLPPETSVVFLFGFFRRDYGAAGLFDLYNQGLMTGDGLIVTSITLTLFVPCIAQFAVMIKEYGLKVGLFISGFIFPLAFFIGYLVHLLLTVI